jgi:hypothetical protein
MEILNMNSNQTKPQEIVKISNGQFYDGNIRTVKQRAHKFNAIAISNLNGNTSSATASTTTTTSVSNISVPNKSIGSHTLSMAKMNNKNCENAKKNAEINSTIPKTDSNNNNNHNIKINIVNKYTNKNTTHVATKNINAENEKAANGNFNDATSVLKSDDQNNMNKNNIMNGGGGGGECNTTKIMLNTNDVKMKINQLNQVNVSKASNNTISSNLWNSSGFLRIYCGPDRSEISIEDPNRMVNIYSTSSTIEIVKDMGLPPDYTLWCQIGKKSRRLEDGEYPLMIQEEFLKKIGYLDESRRCRLGIDLDLKYLIRFHIGPVDHTLCKGALKCGNVELLKVRIY